MLTPKQVDQTLAFLALMLGTCCTAAGTALLANGQHHTTAITFILTGTIVSLGATFVFGYHLGSEK